MFKYLQYLSVPKKDKQSQKKTGSIKDKNKVIVSLSDIKIIEV
ncbi:hypothetical protein MSHRCOH1_04005 [Candidatus Ornithobacterium hominis]|nr:hypothetical protein MSHRCOH1_04005 [Candidatus Ornithobacterium hominis]SZD73225.1 Uncharacterised protein [Candidatus Ornithobacterium hominis]